MKFGITVAFLTWTITYCTVYTHNAYYALSKNIFIISEKIVIYKSQIYEFIESYGLRWCA